MTTEAQVRQALCATISTDVIVPLTLLKVDSHLRVYDIVFNASSLRTPKNGRERGLKKTLKTRELVTTNTPKQSCQNSKIAM